MIDAPPAVICESPRALDGDTIACANLPRHVRLLGIDAPELPGHCRPGRTCTPGDGAASARVLTALLGLGPVLITPKAHDRYGRILARASTADTGADLSCGMIATGAAVRRMCAFPIPPFSPKALPPSAHGCPVAILGARSSASVQFTVIGSIVHRSANFTRSRASSC